MKGVLQNPGFFSYILHSARAFQCQTFNIGSGSVKDSTIMYACIRANVTFIKKKEITFRDFYGDLGGADLKIFIFVLSFHDSLICVGC